MYIVKKKIGNFFRDRIKNYVVVKYVKENVIFLFISFLLYSMDMNHYGNFNMKQTLEGLHIRRVLRDILQNNSYSNLDNKPEYVN